MLLTAHPETRPRGVLPPCRRCGSVDPQRMHALMAIWFSRVMALPVDSGYFYLCPACYQTCVAPHEDEIFRRTPLRITRPDPSSSADPHQ